MYHEFLADTGNQVHNCIQEDNAMPEEQSVGCARPTGGPVGEPAVPSDNRDPNKPAEKEKRRMIMVGKKAPDFAAPAYWKGQFVSVKLSEYLGKWVVLCCYPGDFTFV